MKRMRISRGLMRLVLGLLVLIAMILWSGGCFDRKLNAGGAVVVQTGIVLPEGTALAQVQVAELSPQIDIVGTVESEEQINLSSRISAYVKQVFVSAGDVVTTNQELILLDDREMKEQFAMAEAEFKQAETEFRRMKELVLANAGTDQQMTTAQANYDRARSALKRIKVMLTYTRIVSPIDGMVTDRRIEAGDLANPGEVLLAVYDTKNLRIVVPVPVRLVSTLQLGAEVDVVLEPYGKVKGTVSAIVGEIDPRSRTQNVKIRLNDLEDAVIPGTFGRVWVADDARNGMLVPRDAVYKIGQLEMVQVAEDGRGIRRLIKTGPTYGDQVEVLSGLVEGDRVVLTPIH